MYACMHACIHACMYVASMSCTPRGTYKAGTHHHTGTYKADTYHHTGTYKADTHHHTGAFKADTSLCRVDVKQRYKGTRNLQRAELGRRFHQQLLLDVALLTRANLVCVCVCVCLHWKTTLSQTIKVKMRSEGQTSCQTSCCLAEVTAQTALAVCQRFHW